MEHELYMPPCCIQNKLPKLLRDNEGRMVQFYSQGDWGISRLWAAVSRLVEKDRTLHDQDPASPVSHVRCMLVVQNLDLNILSTVCEYVDRAWIDHITVISHTTTISPERYAEQIALFKDKIDIRIGFRAASLAPLWLRYEDISYNALLVSGPMFPTDKLNPTFAPYSATFFDRKQDGTVNDRGRQLVEMTTAVWNEMLRTKI